MDNLVNNELCNHLLDLMQFSVIICSLITSNWLIKKNFFHQSEHCNLLFLLLEDNAACVLLFRPHFQIRKQKVYMLLENWINYKI